MKLAVLCFVLAAAVCAEYSADMPYNTKPTDPTSADWLVGSSWKLRLRYKDWPQHVDALMAQAYDPANTKEQVLKLHREYAEKNGFGPAFESAYQEHLANLDSYLNNWPKSAEIPTDVKIMYERIKAIAANPKISLLEDCIRTMKTVLYAPSDVRLYLALFGKNPANRKPAISQNYGCNLPVEWAQRYAPQSAALLNSILSGEKRVPAGEATTPYTAAPADPTQVTWFWNFWNVRKYYKIWPQHVDALMAQAYDPAHTKEQVLKLHREYAQKNGFGADFEEAYFEHIEETLHYFNNFRSKDSAPENAHIMLAKVLAIVNNNNISLMEECDQTLKTIVYAPDEAREWLNYWAANYGCDLPLEWARRYAPQSAHLLDKYE